MGRAGASRPVRHNWSPAWQSARKEAELVKWAGAPTRRQMHQVRRGPPRLVSMRGGHRIPWCLPTRVPTLQPNQPGLLQAQAHWGEL